ncbi:pectate lyase involved in the degradation: msE.0A [Caudoviricetes sp.]|nr:pectate lyase involved in the degradation: msE.0A [Caudoviricetes sp.]
MSAIVEFHPNPYESPLQARDRFRQCCLDYDEVRLMGDDTFSCDLVLPAKDLFIDLGGHTLNFVNPAGTVVRAIRFTQHACYDIEISNGKIKGEYGDLNVPSALPQNHAIFLYDNPQSTNFTPRNRNLTLSNVTIENFHGDGVYVSNCTLTAIKVLSCVHGRNGFTTTKDAILNLDNCASRLVNGQAFDSEPVNGTCEAALRNCTFEASHQGRYAVALSGGGKTQKSNFIVENCAFYGAVNVVWCTAFIRNSLFATTHWGDKSTPHLALLRLYRNSDTILNDCKFILDGDDNVNSIIQIYGTGWGDTPTAIIRDLKFDLFAAPQQYLINMSGANSVSLDGVEVETHTDTPEPQSRYLYIRTTIGRWENGVMVEAGHSTISLAKSKQVLTFFYAGNQQANGVAPTLSIDYEANCFHPPLIASQPPADLTAVTIDQSLAVLPPPTS